MPAGGAHSVMRSWSPEEDALLLNLVDTEGPRWKLIAATLGDANSRTPAMVRNRYLRILKGRKRAAEGQARNKCGRCGQLKQGHVCTAIANVTPSLAMQQKVHAASRADTTSSTQVLAPTVNTQPLALSEVAEPMPAMPAGLSLGNPGMLTCVDVTNENASGNLLPTNPHLSSTGNSLFAPIMSWPAGDSKDEGACDKAAMASLPIAPSCVWSPATSPDAAAATPDGYITAASLLAPTPEGMTQGSYTFPLSRGVEGSA